MHDTLDHLVSHTIQRPDSSKFLYILNQIDTTAREDNPEDVAASWQRALAQKGLTAGRFYRIYNPAAAVPIADDNLRARFEAKRDADLADIHSRMYEVEVERAYRVVAILEQTARDLEEKVVPTLQELIARWRRRVLWADGILFGTIIAALLAWTLWTGQWVGWSFTHPVWAQLLGDPLLRLMALGVILGVGGYGHFTIRNMMAKRLSTKWQRDTSSISEAEFVGGLLQAFRRNTRWWRSVFCKQPTGWGPRARRLVKEVLMEANYYVQELNNKFTNPSGTHQPVAQPVDNAPVPERVSISSP
jgi:hypothetical protein